MNKKMLLIIISIIIVIILVLGVLIILNNQKNGEKESKLFNQSDNKTEEKIAGELVEESDVKKIYNLENIINYYFSDLQIAVEESRYGDTSIKSIESEILEELDIPENKKFQIKKMYKIEANSKNTICFLEGILIPQSIETKSEENRKVIEMKLTAIIDLENNTFSVSRYGNKLKDIIKYDEEILKSVIDYNKLYQINENIEKEYYNNFEEKEVSEEEIANRYYKDYHLNALYYPEIAYKMIDDDYKKERFPDFESYLKYVEEFKTSLQESILTQYSVDNMNEYTQYTLVDSHQNSYFIKFTTSPMDYKITLDNYTIKTDSFLKKYNALSDEKKVVTNAHIFIQMINTKDYKHAYDLLAKNFKNNNFKTLEEFEVYAKDNFLSYNIEEESSITQEGKNYVYKLRLRDSDSRAANIQNMTIIMQLEEGTDFVMSFSIE